MCNLPMIATYIPLFPRNKHSGINTKLLMPSELNADFAALSFF